MIYVTVILLMMVVGIEGQWEEKKEEKKEEKVK